MNSARRAPRPAVDNASSVRGNPIGPTDAGAPRRAGSRLLSIMSETPSPSVARTAVVAAALELFARTGVRGDLRRADRPRSRECRAARSSGSSAARRTSSSPTTRCCSTNCGSGSSEGPRRTRGPRCARRPSGSSAISRPIPRSRAAGIRSCGGVPALREREIITVFRYERQFDEYLRAALPEAGPARCRRVRCARDGRAQSRAPAPAARHRARAASTVLRAALDDVLAAVTACIPTEPPPRRRRRRRRRVPPSRCRAAEIARRVRRPPRFAALRSARLSERVQNISLAIHITAW